MLPTRHFDTVSEIGRARFDIRGITELLQHVANGTGVESGCGSDGSVPQEPQEQQKLLVQPATLEDEPLPPMIDLHAQQEQVQAGALN